MSKAKTINQELDQVYDLVDGLMWKDKWRVLDEILEYITSNVWRYNIDILVGWATITLAGKHKLEKRKAFLDKCKQIHSNENLWKGLD